MLVLIQRLLYIRVMSCTSNFRSKINLISFHPPFRFRTQVLGRPEAAQIPTLAISGGDLLSLHYDPFNTLNGPSTFLING